jgi:NAD(P)-dependent dehydrogenase (short-subunit alcohol dehydrogenase family)
VELHGKRILVAGATGALGGALSRALAEAGAELALAGRDQRRLEAIGRERRRYGVAVLDVRPPHMDTRFGERALFGRAPDLPEPIPVDVVVDTVLEAIRSERREIAWDLKARALTTA